MKVSLVDYTQDPERKIAEYAAICYDADTSEEACARRMTKLLNLGHLATLRFAYATFKVEDISRACSHQFVRASHLQFLQESQRYVNQESREMVFPKSIRTVEQAKIEKITKELYTSLIDAGIKKEDARYVLPNASATSLYVTGNFQAWRDFLRNRLDKAAQWEIREVAQAIHAALLAIAPNVFKEL